jgi:hypothetical protein
LAQVLETHDLETFAEASVHPDWDTSMNEEYHSLMASDTWDLVPLPKGRKLVRCKQVYITKYESNGSVERHCWHKFDQTRVLLRLPTKGTE